MSEKKSEKVKDEKAMSNEKTLGERIGVVEHVCSTTNSKKESIKTTVKIDFTGASDEDIRGWITANRIIVGQSAWRTLSKEEIEENVNGMTFAANGIGKKIRSKQERVKEFVKAGIPRSLAETMVEDPEKAKEIFKKFDEK